jgi:hypothetical protein
MDAGHEQCPFLNRSQQRCSPYFSIEQLEHVLSHCFDEYRACDVYLELLRERQRRHRRYRLGSAASAVPGESSRDHAQPFVQITISRHHEKPLAPAA